MPAAAVFDGLTPKRYRFCSHYMTMDPEELGRGIAAYKKSYNAQNMDDAQIAREVTRLLDDPKIVQRCREIEEEHLAEMVITKGWVLKRLVKRAEDEDQAGAQVKALELLGKSLGPENGGSMFVDRQIETIMEQPELDLITAVSMVSERAARVLAEDLGVPYKEDAQVLTLIDGDAS